MKYDKIAGKVGYIDKTHIYEDIETKKRYTSVTQLIHRYAPPFKSSYWSLYKACKDVMEEEGTWYNFKVRAGGWEGVVALYEKLTASVAATEQMMSIFKRKQWYLDKWETEKNSACELGTAIHNELESAAHHSQRIREGEVNYEVTETNILDIQNFNSNGLYPELLIYSDEYMVSGQVDKCFRQGKWVDIHDYKTCKSIDTEGFRGETLLGPVAHLQNANYWIYSLQLSMYAYMLELQGFKVRSLQMHWIHGKNKEDKKRDAGVKTYVLPYLRKEVISILKLQKTA